MDWVKTNARQDEKQLAWGIWCDYIRGLVVYTVHPINMYMVVLCFVLLWLYCDVFLLESCDVFTHNFQGYLNHKIVLVAVE